LLPAPESLEQQTVTSQVLRVISSSPWLSRFRRLARDFERYARTVAAFIHLGMIRIMLKRLVASSSS